MYTHINILLLVLLDGALSMTSLLFRTIIYPSKIFRMIFDDLINRVYLVKIIVDEVSKVATYYKIS